MNSPVFHASCPAPANFITIFFENSKISNIEIFFKLEIFFEFFFSNFKFWACTWQHRHRAQAAPTQSASGTDAELKRHRRRAQAAPTQSASGTDAELKRHRRKAPTGHVHPWACTWQHRRRAPAAPTQSASGTDAEHRRGHVHPWACTWGGTPFENLAPLIGNMHFWAPATPRVTTP